MEARVGLAGGLCWEAMAGSYRCFSQIIGIGADARVRPFDDVATAVDCKVVDTSDAARPTW